MFFQLHDDFLFHEDNGGGALVDDLAQVGDVVVEGAPAFLAQAHTRAGLLADEVFLDLGIPGPLPRS